MTRGVEPQPKTLGDWALGDEDLDLLEVFEHNLTQVSLPERLHTLISHTVHSTVNESRLSLASSFTSSGLSHHDAFLTLIHGKKIVACSLVIVQDLRLNEHLDIPASGSSERRSVL
jgi:hypothetical protein